MKAPRKAEASPSGDAFTPEVMAKRAVARKPTTPSGHCVKLTLTLVLPHEVAEYVTARAIRERKNVAGLIAEIIGTASRR